MLTISNSSQRCFCSWKINNETVILEPKNSLHVPRKLNETATRPFCKRGVWLFCLDGILENTYYSSKEAQLWLQRIGI